MAQWGVHIMASKFTYFWIFLGLLGSVVMAARAEGDPGEKKPLSPYTPVVPLDDRGAIAPPQGSTFEVHCDDPLEKTHDCKQKARDLCHGEFRQLKFSETEDSERSARHVQLHGSTMSLAATSAPSRDALRTLVFSCGSAKKP